MASNYAVSIAEVKRVVQHHQLNDDNINTVLGYVSFDLTTLTVQVTSPTECRQSSS